MTLAKLFRLMQGRKPQSQGGRYVIFVDARGRILRAIRKAEYTLDELLDLRDRECPTAAFFVADARTHHSESALQKRIHDCVRLFSRQRTQLH